MNKKIKKELRNYITDIDLINAADFYWWGGLQINWILMWMLAILYFCRSIQPQPSLFFHSHNFPLIWYFHFYSYLCSLFFSYFTILRISFLSSFLLSTKFFLYLSNGSFLLALAISALHSCFVIALPSFVFPLFFPQLPSLPSFVFLAICSTLFIPLLTTTFLVLLYFSLKLLIPHLFFHLLFPQLTSLFFLFMSLFPHLFSSHPLSMAISSLFFFFLFRIAPLRHFRFPFPFIHPTDFLWIVYKFANLKLMNLIEKYFWSISGAIY